MKLSIKSPSVKMSYKVTNSQISHLKFLVYHVYLVYYFLPYIHNNQKTCKTLSDPEDSLKLPRFKA